MDEKMNTRKYTFFVALALVAAMASPAFCAKGYVLLIEQTPIEGGTVSPSVGVHHFAIGEKVELMATPKPGYQFVRWMGDVSASDSGRTSVVLDSPKMLVAVFEKNEFALPFTSPDLGQSDATTNNNTADGGNNRNAGTGGGLTAQNVPFGGGGGISPASEGGDVKGDNIVYQVVPEPTTMALFGIGGIIGLVRRRI